MAETKIQTLALGPLGANCYILTDEASGQIAVIDPGIYDATLAAAAGELRQGSVIYILLTHGHFDHILGTARLQYETGAAIAIHRLDAPCLQDGRLSHAERYYPGKQEACEPQLLLDEGSELLVGSMKLKALHTPGHTRGSVCYYCENEKILFSGDTLFRGTVGRTDFEGGDAGQMMESLAKLLMLGDTCAVYPGHDRATTIGYERAHNPYARRLK